MIEMIKRYAMALLFLSLVIFLMILGTYGVKRFGDKMLEKTDVVMSPRGQKVNL